MGTKFILTSLAVEILIQEVEHAGKHRKDFVEVRILLFLLRLGRRQAHFQRTLPGQELVVRQLFAQHDGVGGEPQGGRGRTRRLRGHSLAETVLEQVAHGVVAVASGVCQREGFGSGGHGVLR